MTTRKVDTTLEDCRDWLDAQRRLAEREGSGSTESLKDILLLTTHVIYRAIERRDQPALVIDRPWRILGFEVAEPILERMRGDHGGVRLVVEMSAVVADVLRRRFSLASVPAPLDASDAIVAATRSIAGATNELTVVLKALRDKL